MASTSGPAEALSLALSQNINNTAIPFTGTSPDPHSSLQDFAIFLEVFLPLLAFIVCCLRCYIRVSTKTIGWDDYWVFGAMVLCIAQAPFSIMYIKITYLGIHNADTPPHDSAYPIFISYFGGLIYNPILSMVKVSILVFLLRLAGTKPAVRATIWVLMLFTIGMMIAIFFCVLFVCDPVAFNWDPSIKNGHCFDKKPFSLWTSGVTIFTDILVLALPFWIFLGLRMARKAKIALLFCFGLGAIVTIMGGVRLYYIYINVYIPRQGDSNYSLGYTTTAFETNLAVITASGPALWPLARKWFPGFFNNLGLSQGYQGQLPTIETTMLPHDLAKEETRSSSQSRKLLNFGLFHKKPSPPVSVQAPKPSRQADQQWGAGVYTGHTVGGTSFALRDMRGDRAKGRSEIRSHTPEESEEEIMTYNGIVRTRDYSVTRDNPTSEATEKSWFDDRGRENGST